MPLPRFLIIGAMKSGTTSLYRDLCTNRAVYMPLDKEPHSLCDDRILTATGLAEYERHFSPAAPDQICGEASTGYTKAPDFPDVPRRTRAVLGDDVKLIYLMREPVSRIVSHHRHRLHNRRMDTDDINEAVRRHTEFIDWSRYAMQANLWLEEFDRDRLLLIRFEDYIADRRAAIERISRFLGIEPRPELVDVEAVFNRSEGKPVASRPLRAFVDSRVYRRAIRPLMPASAKDWFRRHFMPKAESRTPPLSPDTVEWIIDRLRDDLDELQRLMNLDAPVWDMEAVAARYDRS